MIINANALKIPLADNSIQCAITSPPYWGLRDYGSSDQLGLEKTPEEYVANMVHVFREVWRVLKDDGVLWLNLGDSYAGSGKGRNADGTAHHAGFAKNRKQSTHKGTLVGNVQGGIVPQNMKPKNLVGIPWMVAFALRSDGWYLRQDIIWHKPNPMPESVRDRCTKSHEYIFLLTKSARYYYDHEAIKEKAIHREDPRAGYGRLHYRGKRQGKKGEGQESFVKIVEKRNKRSVWTVTTKPYRGAHFATFPADLVEPMVLAGSREGDIVMDPFSGTSTVGQVATKHKRKYAGVELSFDYIKLAKKRLSAVQVCMI